MQSQFTGTTFDYKSQDLFSSSLNVRSKTIRYQNYIQRQVSLPKLHLMRNERYISKNITISHMLSPKSATSRLEKYTRLTETWIVIISFLSIWQQTEFQFGANSSKKSTIRCSFSCGTQFQFSETTFDHKSQDLLSCPLNVGSIDKIIL